MTQRIEKRIKSYNCFSKQTTLKKIQIKKYKTDILLDSFFYLLPIYMSCLITLTTF